MSRTNFFFYGNERIDVVADVLNGAAIKQEIKRKSPSVDLGFELVLEGQGHDADQVIADGTDVPLAIGHGVGPKRFFLRPPTNFGAC